MKKHSLIAVFSFLFCFASYSQVGSVSELKSKFKDAEYDFSQEDYYLALSKYAYCYKFDTLNANVNYCVGYCYLKTQFEKTKAIPYLERAVKEISKDYKEGSYDERKAKPEAWLYLGQAYRLNGEYEKAVSAFSEYKKIASPSEKKNIALADQEIKTCSGAKETLKKPVVMISRNNISDINSAFSDYSAVFSADEKIVVFVNQQLEGKSNDDRKLMFSKKTEDKWMEPYDITDIVKTKGNMAPTYLSADGKYMLLAENDDSKTALYESRFVKDADSANWTPAKKLNGNINKGRVTHATLTPDGKTLYFTSDRKEGFGGLDIYKSEKKGDDWGPAINLGSKINTSLNEETPFFLNDKTMYFSSEGHTSIGGLDVFVSRMSANGEWGTPENLGYMFNTPEDNSFFVPMKDGSYGIMSLTGDDATGELDVYKVSIVPYVDPDAERIAAENAEKEKALKEQREKELLASREKEQKEKAEKEQKEKAEAEKEQKNNTQNKNSNNKTDKNKTDKKSEQNNNQSNSSGSYSPTYAIQVATSTRTENPYFFSGLKNVKEIKCKDGKYRYVYGEFPNYRAAKDKLEQTRNSGFKTAFIVKYDKFKEKHFDGSNPENSNDLAAKLRKPKFFAVHIASSITELDTKIFKNLGAEIKSSKAKNGYTGYFYGRFEGYKAAHAELQNARTKGYVDAFLIYTE